LLRLEEGARAIKRKLRSGPVGVLFGSERFGLSNEELSHCHWVMRIPTREEHDSMNLGQAVAVCLYELLRGQKTAPAKIVLGKKRKRSAISGDVERMTQMLLKVLGASGYVKTQSASATEAKLHRLVRRMELNAEDTDLWLGMLRQVAWKLGAIEKDNG
jgi:TrmH family RNA methyltransferase